MVFSDQLRFHLLSIPHTVTGSEWSVCPFTTKVWKFAKMMKSRGHHIIHYGHEHSKVDCDEHVTLITNEDFTTAYGDYNWREKSLYHFANTGDHCHKKFNTLAVVEVKKRLHMKDFVLCFWGSGHMAAGMELVKDERAIVVEPGVGYNIDQCFAPYKVFESYAHRHQYTGFNNGHAPSWYDGVVPLACDKDQFTVSKVKEDYFLYIGRIINDKGLDKIIVACNHLGVRLKVAGQPAENLSRLGVPITDNIEYVGLVGVEDRRELMSKAKGFICLSSYIEPFGSAIVEAMMSGCPVITPDWGAFTETVEHGKTGYRIRNGDQLIWAIENIDKIDPGVCREWAVKNYGLDRVSRMFEDYFYSLKLNLSYEWGWWTISNERTNLDSLVKDSSML